jgi:hypothetical protein
MTIVALCASENYKLSHNITSEGRHSFLKIKLAWIRLMDYSGFYLFPFSISFSQPGADKEQTNLTK